MIYKIERNLTMKKTLSLLLAMCLMISMFAFSVSAEEPNVDKLVTESVQPILDGETTLSVGNSWTDVKKDYNLFNENVTITNNATSIYSVCIRLVDYQGATVLKTSQTIESGCSYTFFNVRAGGYIIQAKSADGVPHEYTISYTDK